MCPSSIYATRPLSNVPDSPVRSIRIKSHQFLRPLEVLGVRTSGKTVGSPQKLTAPHPQQSNSVCLSGVLPQEMRKVSFDTASESDIDSKSDSSSNTDNDDDAPARSERLPWDTRPSALLRGKKRIHEPPSVAIPSGDGKFHFRTLPVRWQIRINDSEGPLEHSLLDNCSGLSLMSQEKYKQYFSKVKLNPETIGVAGIGRARSLGSLVTYAFVEARNGEMIKLDVEFHVLPDFQPGFCIGVDVMNAFKIDFLASEKCAYVRKLKLKIPVQFERSTQKNMTIKASKNVIIPPESHKIIQVEWNPGEPSVDHFFEPCISMSSAVQAFGMASKAVISGRAKQIVYSNFGRQPIHIKKGERIGKACPLRADHHYKDMNESMVLDASLSSEDLSDVLVPKKEKENELKVGDIPEFPSFPSYPVEVNHPNKDGNCPTVAMVPDTQDKSPIPKGPTYKQFDIALNEHGVPHPEIIKVIEENIEAFALDGRPGRVKDGTELKIKTDDSKLVPEPMRKVGPEKQQVIRDTIKQLLDWNVIEKSNSKVSYPILLVWQESKWRFCIDYRKLNDATESDTYPMARIDTMFDALSGMSYFTILDALRGYHNIPVAEADRWKTAFISAEGLYQFLGMPFGLKNAPAVFQRFIDALLGHLRWKAAMAYIDDIIMYAHTLSQHVKDLDYILKQAIRVGLKFTVTKCHFGYTNLSLLGRIVGIDGLQVNRHRAQAVLDMKVPENMKELYTAIGMFGSYRAFIYGFAIIAAPLTSLTIGNKFRNADSSPNIDWQKKVLRWGPDQQKAYDDLKRIIASPPVLTFPDFSLPFFIYMDACKIGFAFC